MMTINSISTLGEHILEAREGIRLKVYLDTKGIPTVGVGHVVLPEDNLKVGDTITQDQVDIFFAKDLLACESEISKRVTVDVSQNQYDALVSFVFNIGVHGFDGSHVLIKLNHKDFQGAADAMLLWEKPPEIIGRRETERKQFLTPYTINHS